MRAKLPTTLITPLTRPPPSIRIPHNSAPPPCAHHNSLHRLPLPSLRPPQTRTLTATPPLKKKGAREHHKRLAEKNAEKSPNDDANPADALDFTDYEAAIARAHSQLASGLSKIKAGGRNTDAIEDLRVRLLLEEGKERMGKEKGNKEVKGRGGDKGMVVRLGDLASVVPRGRNVAVMVGEKDHIKPITTALLTSPTPLPPTPSPTDPLTLSIAIPPTTAESRQLAQTLASKKGEEALFALREARGAQRKRHRAMELGRLVGPDELYRAQGEVEKVNERAVGEARKMVEGCRRGLEGG